MIIASMRFLKHLHDCHISKELTIRHMLLKKCSDTKFYYISPSGIRGVAIRKIEKTEQIILEIMIENFSVFSLNFYENFEVYF